jgi:hypothetical protein
MCEDSCRINIVVFSLVLYTQEKFHIMSHLLHKAFQVQSMLGPRKCTRVELQRHSVRISGAYLLFWLAREVRFSVPQWLQAFWDNTSISNITSFRNLNVSLLSALLTVSDISTRYVEYVTGWATEKTEFDVWYAHVMLLIFIASRPPCGPTPLSMEKNMGDFSSRLSCQDVQLTTSTWCWS